MNDKWLSGAPRAGLLDLLDRPDDLPEAIEERIVGPDLWELVNDLEAFHGQAGRPILRQEPTPDMLARILAAGLLGLSEDEFHSLMRQPRALFQVQKAVLSDGSAYWEEVARRTSGAPFPPAGEEPIIGKAAPYRPWYRSPWAWTANALTGLAAAVVLIALVARLDNVERQLREETAKNNAIGRELFALKSLHPRADPTDLPEIEYPVSKALDPADLPEGDPHDLPEVGRAAGRAI